MIRATSSFTLFMVAFMAPVLAAQQQSVGGGYDRDFTWFGSELGETMGLSIGQLGDVNGDGIDDLIAGAPGATLGLGHRHGKVQVRSGADGTLIYEHLGTEDSDALGWGTAHVGDQDGDGISDYGFNSNRNGGSLQIHSGATGLFLTAIPHPGTEWDFAHNIGRAGDLDGDGVEDLFLTAHGVQYACSTATGAVLWSFSSGQVGNDQVSVADYNADGFQDCLVGDWSHSHGSLQSTGGAFLLSGIDGTVIHTFLGGIPGGFFGHSVAHAGDHNADGTPDLAIGAMLETEDGVQIGHVYVYSGADFSLMRTYSGSERIVRMGASCDNAGDLNGDGFDDLMVSSSGAGGVVSLFSGIDGSLIYRIASHDSSGNSGNEVLGLGDIDQDGKLDLLISNEWESEPSASFSGAVSMYSYREFLTASSNTISASAGGNIALEMDFPSGTSVRTFQQYYRILISATGVGPTRLGGIQIPLTPDPLWDRSVIGILPAAFSQSTGNLNLDADASMTLRLPPGVASAWVGSTVYVSALHVEYAAYGFLHAHGASVAVPITITP